jgi:hypothetical protein
METHPYKLFTQRKKAGGFATEKAGNMAVERR